MTIELIVIAICLGVGLFFEFKTDSVDSPGEQIAERILSSEGIDVDFSAGKKAAKDVKKD